LVAALASPLSEAQAEVVRGRLDGLSTTSDLQNVKSITPTSDSYSIRADQSWLQLWLIANGATLDRRLELATTVYAAVVASPQNGPLLESRAENIPFRAQHDTQPTMVSWCRLHAGLIRDSRGLARQARLFDSCCC
jgi:hypothetical protein